MPWMDNSMEGADFMDEFGCDYACRTVGESITKYNVPGAWCAEFEAYDDVYPVVSIPVGQIRKSPNMMALKLRVVENEDEEYAGCMVLTDQKIIAFKVDRMNDLVKAMNTK